MCIGRPDFQALARDLARDQGAQHNFKLIPMYVLTEMYVRWREGRLSKEAIRNLLLTFRGYCPVEFLDRLEAEPS